METHASGVREHRPSTWRQRQRVSRGRRWAGIAGAARPPLFARLSQTGRSRALCDFNAQLKRRSSGWNPVQPGTRLLLTLKGKSKSIDAKSPSSATLPPRCFRGQRFSRVLSLFWKTAPSARVRHSVCQTLFMYGTFSSSPLVSGIV
jgi:hypothetical protein